MCHISQWTCDPRTRPHHPTRSGGHWPVMRRTNANVLETSAIWKIIRRTPLFPSASEPSLLPGSPKHRPRYPTTQLPILSHNIKIKNVMPVLVVSKPSTSAVIAAAVPADYAPLVSALCTGPKRQLLAPPDYAEDMRVVSVLVGEPSASRAPNSPVSVENATVAPALVRGSRCASDQPQEPIGTGHEVAQHSPGPVRLGTPRSPLRTRSSPSVSSAGASVRPALSIGSCFTLRFLVPLPLPGDDHACYPTAQTPHIEFAGAASVLLSSLSVPRAANRLGLGVGLKPRRSVALMRSLRPGRSDTARLPLWMRQSGRCSTVVLFAASY